MIWLILVHTRFYCYSVIYMPIYIFIDVKTPEVKAADLSGYLEVSDLAGHKLRYIPVPR